LHFALLLLREFIEYIFQFLVEVFLVSTTEEILGRNSSGSGLEMREYGNGDPLR
jgi:hypothetical protein